VIKTYELVESSIRGERKEFAAMLAFAQAQNETVAVTRVENGQVESNRR
jgi:hypothetical protein